MRNTVVGLSNDLALSMDNAEIAICNCDGWREFDAIYWLYGSMHAFWRVNSEKKNSIVYLKSLRVKLYKI